MIQQSPSFTARILLLLTVPLAPLSAQQAMSPPQGTVAAQNTPLQPAELASKLDSQLRGNIVTLRTPSKGDVLKFNADGTAANTQKSGAWTLFSKVQIQRAEVSSHWNLNLSGKRVFVRLDKGDKEQLFAGDQKVRIEVDFNNSPDMQTITSALHRVFLAPGEPMAKIVPAYWQAFFEKQTTGRANWELHSAGNGKRDTWVANSATSRASRVGGNITPPHAKFTPDPSYDDLTRGYRVTGTTVLWCVVNERGAVEDPQIVKPLGMGLDERAVEALSQWRFRPAMQNGVPVAVQINVEVNFKLN